VLIVLSAVLSAALATTPDECYSLVGAGSIACGEADHCEQMCRDLNENCRAIVYPESGGTSEGKLYVYDVPDMVVNAALSLYVPVECAAREDNAVQALRTGKCVQSYEEVKDGYIECDSLEDCETGCMEADTHCIWFMYPAPFPPNTSKGWYFVHHGGPDLKSPPPGRMFLPKC